MTLTIKLPPQLQAALDADAQAHARPAEEIAADRLAISYGFMAPESLPVVKSVTETMSLTDTSGAAVLAQWEKDGVFLPIEDLPESRERARQIREQGQAPRFDSAGRRF